jgi:hypothetical protein
MTCCSPGGRIGGDASRIGVEELLRVQRQLAWQGVTASAIVTTLYVVFLVVGILRIVDSAFPRARTVRS